MRISRKIMFPKDQPVTVELTNSAARDWFMFGASDEQFKLSIEKASILENVLLTLSHTWQVVVLGFNFLNQQYKMQLHFNPARIDALSDRRIAELVADLDVKSQARAKMSAEKREEWIKDFLSNPDSVKHWRDNLKNPSVFMQYFDESISKKMNKLDKKHGTLWADRYKPTVSVGAEGLLAGLMDVDLAQIRARKANNLDRCRHSSIYYRLVDIESLPESEREHARKMKAMLCPVEEMFAACGLEHEPLSLEDYVELLHIEGRIEDRRAGKSRISPEELFARYGLRFESVRTLAEEAFAKCANFIGKPSDILAAGQQIGRNMQRAALAAAVLFCRH